MLVICFWSHFLKDLSQNAVAAVNPATDAAAITAIINLPLMVRMVLPADLVSQGRRSARQQRIRFRGWIWRTT
jgi:hypothetical protein